MFGNNIIGGVARNTLTLPRILNGISKTLGVVNQAIPLYKQAKPMIEKGRTLFKLATEFNKSSTPPTKSFTTNSLTTKKEAPKLKSTSSNKPVFFQ